MNNYAFTYAALQALLERPSPAWFADPSMREPAETRVETVDLGDTRFFAHESDPTDDDQRLLIIARQGPDLFGPVPPSAYSDVFHRLHRVAHAADSPPLTLPYSWSKFQSDNLVAFFACPRALGTFRWIAEIGPDGSSDVCYWHLTTSDAHIELEDFQRPAVLHAHIRSGWSEAQSNLRRQLNGLPEPAVTKALQEVVDLEATSFGAVTQHRTFSEWEAELTDGQRRFVNDQPNGSVKLRGPAGSGKTLALELKALGEVYRAADAGRDLAVLFTTHSWAVAEQVDDALRQMDDRGLASSITVYPLTSIAQELLPSSDTGPSLELLGEDSLSGKRLQINRIDKVLDTLARGDWLAYGAHASEEFSARVKSKRGSAERNALVWDLMVEFACVLSANGILPGINAERQYLGLSRTPWMMPLHTDADKRFALRVYTDYVGELRQGQTLTSDQLINDFLNYLETFSWNVRRTVDGYDLIFVDELHLFNEQERLVLHYLTRLTDEYPTLFMALDPRQSPAEIYVDVAPDSITRPEMGLADSYLGDNVRAVDLRTVHRFGPELLALVQHVNQSYPALGLGEDWQLDLEGVVASGPENGTPSIYVHGSPEAEVEACLASARQLSASAVKGDRIAIIVLEPLRLELYRSRLDAAGDGTFSVVESRDDVDKLRYSKRAIIVGAAEFLGGLQFTSVIVAGFPSSLSAGANMGHQRRRFLSLFYLAVSRASRHLELHVNDTSGGIPDILESAVAEGIVELKPS